MNLCVFAVFVSAHALYTLSMVSVRLIQQQNSPLFSLYFSMHERNPPLQNAPFEDGHTAWSKSRRTRVSRRISVHIPPIEYHEFCDRIRVSHSVVQRSL